MAEVKKALLTPQREIGDSIEHSVRFLDADGDVVSVGEGGVEGDFVPETRKVNNKALSADVTLAGSDVTLTGLSAGSKSPVVASDTVNQAIGKLVAYIADLEDRLVDLETAP